MFNCDDGPKVYSNVETEDIRPPVFPSVRSNRGALPPPPTLCSRTVNSTKSLSGGPKPCNTEFFKQVYEKLKPFVSESDRNQDAMATLNRHYNAVILPRKHKIEYKVYYQYINFDDSGNKRQEQTYIVRVDQNTLRKVKDKAPIVRARMRYFFKNSNNDLQEAESEAEEIPYLEKNGIRTIYCQVHTY